MAWTIPAGAARRLEELLLGEKGLEREAQALSLRYRDAQSGAGQGVSLLCGKRDVLAYAATRMPATYAAVSAALRGAAPCLAQTPQSCLDVGAGPGTASLAALSIWPALSLCLVERDKDMRALAAELLRAEDKSAQMVPGDLLTLDLPPADLVIAAYCLLEIDDAKLEQAALRLFAAARQSLLIVEPGTPAGFARICRLRQALLSVGAHLAAPCPREGDCPLPGDDWCAFAQRLPRTAAHRMQKGGSLGFEDEKFCYLAVARGEPKPACARVLRHPRIYKGYVDMRVCAQDGIRDLRLTKKSPLYREARDANAGDGMELPTDV